MHVEQISFDRVFDVQQGTGDFSFEHAGWPVYGVNVPGMGVPRQGARYAVAFAEPGNWEKVVGWRDLSTGTVRLTTTTLALTARQLLVLYLLGPMGFAIPLAHGDWTLALVVGVPLLAVSGVVMRRAAMRNRRAQQALRAVHPPLPPRDCQPAPLAWHERIDAVLMRAFSR